MNSKGRGFANDTILAAHGLGGKTSFHDQTSRVVKLLVWGVREAEFVSTRELNTVDGRNMANSFIPSIPWFFYVRVDTGFLSSTVLGKISQSHWPFLVQQP